MPATDAIHCFNLTASEHGLRTRLGYLEWVTGLTGVTSDRVPTILPFTGSAKNGSADRLFATTQTGIWDVSSSTASPTQLVTFGTQNGDAGMGVATVMSTPAGRFLIYTDEENGLFVYSEVSGTWSQVNAGVSQQWAANTFYTFGNQVVKGGNVYTATVEGTSASSGGPTGTGTGITDGTVTWDYVSAAATNVIGPSLADQQAGFTGLPSQFVYATVWKNRLWLVEKDTSRAWYLAPNSLFGTATSFDFGSRMRAGGPLVGLYSWSYDGGSGMDTLLVGISQGGDVVIYQGTDPSSSSTFGIKGTWFVAGVPYGRRIATDYGGDLLVLSLMGIFPLSRLVIGSAVEDRSQYATQKITNLFSQLAATYRDLPGWSLTIHPTDNALIVTVPQAAETPTIQLAMSFATRGWSRYRDLPILSADVWGGEMYFGTVDGRVCVNRGFVDNVQLSDPNVATPVQWSLLTSYQNLGNARVKRVHMIRPILLSEQPSPNVEVQAKFGFDLSEPSPSLATVSPGESGTWDTAVWDVDPWAGDLVPYQPLSGASGMGRDVAIAVRGRATSRTTLVGFDVFFDQGGFL